MELRPDLLRPDLLRPDVLREVLTEGAEGAAGSAVVVIGPVGSGKTRLLTQATRCARDLDMAVLSATARCADDALPLGVLRQLIEAADLPAGDLAHARRVLDEGSAQLLLTDDETGRMRAAVSPLLHALGRVLRRLCAERPLLVTVDDARFADHASLRCLEFLLRRAHRVQAVAMVSDTVEHWRRSSLRVELHSQPRRHEIRLGLLTGAEVADFLARQLRITPSDALVAAYQRVSGGNPRLMTALLVDSAAAGRCESDVVAGAAFGRAVGDCLDRASPRLRDLAVVLAVLDSPVPAEAAGELLDLDAETAADLQATAAETGLTGVDGRCHPRVRAVVLEGLPPARRADLRWAAAGVMRRHGPNRAS